MAYLTIYRIVRVEVLLSASFEENGGIRGLEVGQFFGA